jgi:hypothetical protein
VKKTLKAEAFYFFTSIGNYIEEKASSLEEFLMKVGTINSQSIEFHFYRGDFRKWFKDVFSCDELVEKMKSLEKLNLKGDTLRTNIQKIVSNFLEFNSAERRAREKDLEKYLEQIPAPPLEHAYELEMEKRVKLMIEEQEKRKTGKSNSND